LRQTLTVYETLNDKSGIANIRVGIADFYKKQGNVMKQLECLREGLSVTKSMGYKQGMSRFLIQITFLYAEQGDTAQALSYLEKAIELEKEINDSTRLARGYAITGAIYAQVLRYDKAIEFYEKAIKSYERKKDFRALAENYLKIGDVYRDKNDLSNALAYYEKCSALANQYNDLGGIFFSILAIGQVNERQGDLDKAIEQHKLAFHIGELSKIDEPIALAAGSLARDYYHRKDYQAARKYSDRCLEIGNKRGSVQELFENEKLAYQIDSAANNYGGAYLHFRNYINLKDKVNSEAVHKAAAKEKFQSDLEMQQMAAKAEQDKKDAITNEEKEKQKVIIYSVTTGLFLVIVLVGFVFRGYRQKQKANAQLQAKNEIIAQQKHLVEEKHKEITDSINYAERIQKSFLASKELLDENLGEYFILFKPKDVVSGDFYWGATLTNGHFALVTADSTGHGVPGAIMSLLNIAALEKAVEKNTDPAEILNHTRYAIIQRLKKDGSAEGGKDGMDCSLVIFDQDKKQLHIAAAHNPVWVIRQNELIEIKPDKMPVGKHERDNNSFNSHSFKMEQGDMLYTMTDGFGDQFGGENGKKFMSKNLKELLLKNSKLPMQEQKEMLETAFNTWTGTYEQVDDVTVIGVKI
jgi:serine phosphatase RsbU (regulator of sigma subunit)